MASPFLTSLQLVEAQALLEKLLAEHRPGHALPREFQTDSGIYQLDLERIWRRGWLFAGHTCQVKRPGDYLVFERRHRLDHRHPRRRRAAARAATTPAATAA